MHPRYHPTLLVDSEIYNEEVDPARMQDLKDSLGESLKEVIESYLEDTPLQIEDMRAAYGRGDRDDLERIAHSLKSSSGIFGAHVLADLCRSLEIAAREGGLVGKDPIPPITEAYAKVQAVLNLYMQTK